MRKRLHTRISETFTADNREDAKAYLDWLNSAISDMAQNSRRIVMLMLLLVAIFEFLIQSPELTFTLAGFVISKSSVVIKFIPALAAYLYLQMLVYSQRATDLRDAFRETLACWSPKAQENNLEFLLRPASLLIWNEQWKVHKENKRTMEDTERRISIVFALLILFGMLTFLAQAYYLLFPESKLSNYIPWGISLSITLFCLGSSIAYIGSFEDI